jgi:hypothetical protein
MNTTAPTDGAQADSARPSAPAPSAAPTIADLASEVPAYRARLATDPTRQPRARRDSDHPAGPRPVPPPAHTSGRTPHPAPVPASGQGLLRLAVHRLTERDQWLLRMLLEHRVLTSEQITQLAFGAHRKTTARLAVLHQLGLLDRFRPYTPRGSAPLHYLLAPTGADVLAATTNTTVAALGYRPERLARLAVSLQLAHDVGANGVFTALAAHARTTSATRLRVWWSARRCLTTWDGLIRPDGYGRWKAPIPAAPPTGSPTLVEVPAEVDFFLEYDTGTENLARLTRKLDGYARLATASGLPTLILFWLPNLTRELHLHQAIATWQQARRGQPPLPIATAVPYAPAPSGETRPAAPRSAGPADRVWLPVSATASPGDRLPRDRRVHLAELAPFQHAHLSSPAGSNRAAHEANSGAGETTSPKTSVDVPMTEVGQVAPNPYPPATPPVVASPDDISKRGPRG